VWRDAVEASRHRAVDRGIEPNPERLRVLAGELDSTKVVAEALAHWESEHARLGALLDAAVDQLREALISRSAPSEASPEAAHAAYTIACAERDRIRTLAARRSDLESRLAACETAERCAREAATARERAREGLHAAAVRCNIHVDDETDLLLELRRWDEHRQAERVLHHRALREWSELEGNLQGRSIEEF